MTFPTSLQMENKAISDYNGWFDIYVPLEANDGVDNTHHFGRYMTEGKYKAIEEKKRHEPLALPGF